jgi:hypothetical protein
MRKLKIHEQKQDECSAKRHEPKEKTLRQTERKETEMFIVKERKNGDDHYKKRVAVSSETLQDKP